MNSLVGLIAQAAGGFGFATPAVLAGLLALPVLWVLLRVTPPAPRRQPFPPLALLRGLAGRHETAARTPWWLLALRLLLAALVIIGLAGPRFDPAGRAAANSRPLLLVIDDGWTAAPAWEAKRAAALAVLQRAAEDGRAVQLLTTAPPADGGPLSLGRLEPAEAAREAVRALEPKPWPADHAAARAALEAGIRQAGGNPGREGLWLSDGLLSGQAQDELATAVQRLGALSVMTPPLGRVPVHLSAPQRTAEGLAATITRPAGGVLPPLPVSVRAVDSAGRAVAALPLTLAEGQAEVRAVLPLPPDLRESLARLEAVPAAGAGDGGAAAVVLLDSRWQRRPVGIAGPDGGQGGGIPLLSGAYYLDRALSPFAEVRHGDLDSLTGQKLAVLALPGGIIPAARRDAVDRWVRDGGVLLRFADPLLAEGAQNGGQGGNGADPLLPVRLLAGGRTLGGTLSWAQPMGIAPFADDSPFAGLPIPAEATVRAQVLAEPGPDLPARTWARLADGTPLVTGARHGRGWLVLVHTTANPDWSSLPLSGLFPAMLRRLSDLSVGAATGPRAAAAEPLPPLESLDGFGRATTPPPAAQPLPPGASGQAWLPGPTRPPGWYGSGAVRQALSLGEAVTPPPVWTTLPPGVTRAGLEQEATMLDLRPPLLGAALVLLLLDTLIGFALRGLVVSTRLNRRWTGGAAAALLLLALSAPPPARAEEADPPPALVEAALHPRLAHVLTGNPGVDALSAQGLAGLTQVLGQRTAADLAEPRAVDINRDPLLPYALLYWPAVDGQTLPGEDARARIAAYLDHGGIILFDGRDPGQPQVLRTLLSTLDLPPLIRLPGDHVLTRSFYLLPGLPGRVEGGAVWIEQPGSRLDGVSGVVIGSNDWAGAWAQDAQGRPLLPVLTGQRGREMAQRAGVNVVMYALTGNYKGDQVHLPAIMERLTQ